MHYYITILIYNMLNLLFAYYSNSQMEDKEVFIRITVGVLALYRTKNKLLKNMV